jgi:genome maintenance exonuclease 1
MFTPYQPTYQTINRKKYFCIDNLIYPSVTSILSATKPQEDKQALQRWRNKIGKAQAQKITTEACNRGISLHSGIKSFLNREEVPPEINDNPYWHSIEPVLNNIEQVHLIESFAYHSQHQYAGYFDCLGEWQGELCVFDWKTASRPKKTEWISDYFLQVVAYLAAIKSLYQVKINQGIIAIALPEQPAQIFTLNQDNLQDYWEQFLQRLALWQQLYSNKIVDS